MELSSPQHSLGWEEEDEGEEEPLFADDLDDEDPPPLPPPMPSLSQLPQAGSGGGGQSRTTPQVSGVRGGGGAIMADWSDPPSAATGDGNQDNSGQAAEKKRAPILTLTTERIFSEKGLSRIEKEFPKLKFKGKGHEVSDLSYLMQQYEHWANALYPKMTFRDVTDRIEKLATKKEFKSKLIQMRRRWTRGPTPPPVDDEDDITDNNNRQGNDSSSQTNRQSNHSNSQENNRHGNRSSDSSDRDTEPEIENENDERNLPENRADMEEEDNEVNCKLDREMEEESCSVDDNGFEEIISAAELDAISEEDYYSRKRSPSSPIDRTTSGDEVERKDKKLAVGVFHDVHEDHIDDLLAEEEQLNHEFSSQAIPPGFN